MKRCEKYAECSNSIPNGCGTLGVWEQCFVEKAPEVGRSGLAPGSISDKAIDAVQEAVESLYTSYSAGDLDGWEFGIIFKRIEDLRNLK